MAKSMKTFQQLFDEHTGESILKWSNYGPIYDRHFADYRELPINILEIGVLKGGSMRLWEKYFPKANIYGIDIDEECQQYESDRTKIFIGDQGDVSFLRNIKATIPRIDIIIDDGSHHPYHQYLTFTKLFPKLLKDGGIYIVEDIECNYWRPNTSIYGYDIGYFNFIDWVKGKINCVNSEFSSISNILDIASITFAHNCIIFTKNTPEDRELQDRNYRFKHLT